MKRLFNRAAVLGLSMTLMLGAATVPCAADQAATPRADGTFTRLSPASRQVLAAASPRKQTTSTSGPFLKSTRGKVTLVLMGAGTALTLWSIQHDRKPVKSPIR